MARRHIEFYAASPKAFGDIITPPAGDNESLVFRGAKGQEFLHQISKQFVDGVEAIKEKYQPEIQAEEIKKLAGNLLAQIPAAAEKFLRPITLGFLLSQGKLFQRLNSQSDSAVAAIERMELRQFLKTIDGKEKLRIFEEAADSGNDKIMGAFLQDSELYRLLSPEILAAGQQKWLSKKDPLLALELSENERTGSILAANFENVINDLNAYAPIKLDQVHKFLGEIPKPGWKHLRSGDARAIDNNLLNSRLPLPSQKLGESAESRLTAANKTSEQGSDNESD